MGAKDRSLVADTLRRLVSERGAVLWTTPRLCASLLRDLCPESEAEVFVAQLVVDCRLVERLTTREPPATLYPPLVQALIERRGLSPDSARWAVEVWGAALHGHPISSPTEAPPTGPQRAVSSPSLMGASITPAPSPVAPSSGGGAGGLFQRRLHRWEPFGTLQLPRGGAQAMVFSPDGKLLAVGGQGNTVYVWDVAGGHLVDSLGGHEGAVTSVVFGAGLLASGSVDRTIRLWSTAYPVHPVLHGHRDAVTYVAVEASGGILSVSADQTMRFWDPRTGREAQCNQGVAGKIAYDQGWVVEGRGFHTIALVEPWSQKVHTTREIVAVQPWMRLGKSSTPQPVALSVGTGWLASGGSADGDIYLVNPTKNLTVACKPPHGGPVTALAFARTGETLFSASADMTVRQWRVSDGLLLQTINNPSPIRSIAISPDDRMLAIGSDNEAIHAWRFVD